MGVKKKPAPKNTAVKSKAKAKAKAADPGQQPSRGTTSTFLTGLKYKSLNGKGNDKTNAQKLLETYHNADSSAKHDLIKTYQEKGGIKNLAWVPSYTEQATSSNSDAQEVERGFFVMSKIFERELGSGSAPEKKRQDIVLEAMRIQNYKDYDVDYKDLKDLVKEVPGCPELTKYFFCFGKSSSTYAETKQTNMEISTNLKTSGLALALGDSSSSSCQVKIENPEKVKATEKVGVLKSGKASIEKLINPLEDGISQLQCTKKPEYAEFIKEGNNNLKEAKSFVERARVQISTHAVLQSDENTTKEAWEELSGKMEGMINIATVHVDGLKQFKLRLQAFMS
ncbi:unnamed protein product [Symbiodinium sp. CCMP2592]|nr:unnamed protein product [Symbiodinium sp. CCMP2592]